MEMPRRPNTPCIIWTGNIDPSTGYGRRTINRKSHLAHRLVWEEERGPIPKGLHIDHLCRTPACVNVNHMEVVSCRVNTLRGVGITATQARRTHCIHGHPFSGENLKLIRRRNGVLDRACRMCRQIGWLR
jgi:hypothetical protein